MHSSVLLRMPHWSRVMSMSVKVRRGTSMVWMHAFPYCVPYMTSALAFTVSRVSAGSKCCWNLLPHGARIANRRRAPVSVNVALWGPWLPSSDPAVSSPGLHIWISAGQSASSCLCGVTASPNRLRLDMAASRPGLPSDRFLSMEGRTLYLFNGAPGPCFDVCLRWPACRTTGCGSGRRDLLPGLTGSGESRDAGGLWASAESSWKLFSAGLLRPLDDFGLVKCIVERRESIPTPTFPNGVECVSTCLFGRLYAFKCLSPNYWNQFEHLVALIKVRWWKNAFWVDQFEAIPPSS